MRWLCCTLSITLIRVTRESITSCTMRNRAINGYLCFQFSSLNSVSASLRLCPVPVQSATSKLRGQQIQWAPGVAEPPDVIQWIHNGNKIAEVNGSMERVFGSFEGRVTLNKQNAELQISDLRLEDSGKYESEIQLKGMWFHSSHELVVIGKAVTYVSYRICYSLNLKHTHRLLFNKLKIITCFDMILLWNNPANIIE